MSNIGFLVTFAMLGCLLCAIRTWTFTMVTTVRYELVQLSEVQAKITELSQLVQKVCIVEHGDINTLFGFC